MVKRRKLKFGFNMGINECVMRVNFKDPRSRDRELRHKKHRKMHFLAWKFNNPPTTQKPLDVNS